MLNKVQILFNFKVVHQNIYKLVIIMRLRLSGTNLLCGTITQKPWAMQSLQENTLEKCFPILVRKIGMNQKNIHIIRPVSDLMFCSHQKANGDLRSGERQVGSPLSILTNRGLMDRIFVKGSQKRINNLDAIHTNGGLITG